MNQPRLPKRERTRRKLLAAGLRVLAEKGDALTASDVVAAADVSNGTFYNHFVDRDELVQTLAHESLKAITDGSAEDTDGSEPGWRFAVASTRVLVAAAREPLWGRAVLRLVYHPSAPHAEVQRHLRADLTEGHRLGRFSHGDDPITLDIVVGTLMATLRRIVATPDHPEPPSRVAIPDVVARLLQTLGIAADEARSLASTAYDSENRHPAIA